MEDRLNDMFSDEYTKVRTYDFQRWFPNLRAVISEPGFVELEFAMLSDSMFDPDELQAIANVMGTDLESLDQERESGGCDSCGWGTVVVVRVKGGKVP